MEALLALVVHREPLVPLGQLALVQDFQVCPVLLDRLVLKLEAVEVSQAL